MSNAWKDWWRVGGTGKAYVYVGTDEHAVIPRGCESIGTGVFGMSVPVVEVSVPASVKELDGSVFRRCNTLRRINVDEDNPYFKDVDGVLYSRDGKSLIFYPPAKGNRVVIPEGVVEIKLFAFLGNENIKEIVFPSTLTDVFNGEFKESVALEKASFSSENPQFTVINGVVYSTGCLPSLVLFPKNSDVEDLVIPDGIEHLADYALFGCKNLKSVYIPDSVTHVGDDLLGDCPNLQSVRLPAGFGKRVKYLFGNDEFVPNYVYVGFDRVRYLKGKGKYSAVRGYLSRWKQGELNEDECRELLKLIKEDNTGTFKALNTYVPLYEFMISRKAISKWNVDRFLEGTESLECRALLLGYKRDNFVDDNME